MGYAWFKILCIVRFFFTFLCSLFLTLIDWSEILDYWNIFSWFESQKLFFFNFKTNAYFDFNILYLLSTYCPLNKIY